MIPSPPFGRGRGRGRGRGLIKAQETSPSPPSIATAAEVNVEKDITSVISDRSPPSPPLSPISRTEEVVVPTRTTSRIYGYKCSTGDKGAKRTTLLTSIQDLHDFSGTELALQLSNNLKKVWSQDMSEDHHQFICEVKRSIESSRKTQRNIMALGLFLAVNCPDFFAYVGSSEAAASLKQIITAEDEERFLSKALQRIAFRAAMLQRKQTTIDLLVEVYKLADCSLKPEFVTEIKKLCSKGEFREASCFASALKLHDEFDIHAFVIPLILQDRTNVAEDFLEGSEKLQILTVQFFDDLFVGGNLNVTQTLTNYVEKHQISEVKREKLQHKPMSKLVKRLVSKFRIEHGSCPNVGKRQRFGELKHLFHRRYDKQEMNSESFAELINQIVDGNTSLQDEALANFFLYTDYEAAAKFIITHELFSSNYCHNPNVLRLLPDPHKTRLQEELLAQANAPIESWEDDDPAPDPVETKQVALESSKSIEIKVVENEKLYADLDQLSKQLYIHPLGVEKVKIIDSWTKAKDFYFKLLNDEKNGVCDISGFDSEWKPILSRTSGVAILQIAYKDVIYLLDIVELKQSPSSDASEFWSGVRKAYFENGKIFKLGYDVKNDVKMLTETVHEWKNMNQTWKGIVDLASVKSMIVKEAPKFFEMWAKDLDSAPESGLSELVRICLKKSLNKAEQMSDWEKRPLRGSQVQYAASDAYCLIDVYYKLKKMCQESSIDLEKIIMTCIKSMNQPSQKKMSTLEIVMEVMSKQKEGQGRESCELPLVVDNMFQGLGRHLRACGFDTIIMDGTRHHHDCCQYVRQGRTIITKGVAYSNILSQLPSNDYEHLVYNVKSDNTKEQLEEICNYLNVRLTPETVFTVCQRCNTSEFIELSRDKVLLFLSNWGARFYGRRKADSLDLLKERAPEDLILRKDNSRKTWKLLDSKQLIIVNGGDRAMTPRGKPAELSKLQGFVDVLDRVYVCNDCGKCYWESTELEKWIKTFINREKSGASSQQQD